MIDIFRALWVIVYVYEVMRYLIFITKKITWRLEMNLRTVWGRAIMHELSGLPSEATVKIEVATDADGQEYVHSAREYIPETEVPPLI